MDIGELLRQLEAKQAFSNLGVNFQLAYQDKCWCLSSCCVLDGMALHIKVSITPLVLSQMNEKSADTLGNILLGAFQRRMNDTK